MTNVAEFFAHQIENKQRLAAAGVISQSEADIAVAVYKADWREQDPDSFRLSQHATGFGPSAALLSVAFDDLSLEDKARAIYRRYAGEPRSMERAIDALALPGSDGQTLRELVARLDQGEAYSPVARRVMEQTRREAPQGIPFNSANALNPTLRGAFRDEETGAYLGSRHGDPKEMFDVGAVVSASQGAIMTGQGENLRMANVKEKITDTTDPAKAFRQLKAIFGQSGFQSKNFIRKVGSQTLEPIFETPIANSDAYGNPLPAEWVQRVNFVVSGKRFLEEGQAFTLGQAGHGYEAVEHQYQYLPGVLPGQVREGVTLGARQSIELAAGIYFNADDYTSTSISLHSSDAGGVTVLIERAIPLEGNTRFDVSGGKNLMAGRAEAEALGIPPDVDAIFVADFSTVDKNPTAYWYGQVARRIHDSINREGSQFLRRHGYADLWDSARGQVKWRELLKKDADFEYTDETGAHRKGGLTRFQVLALDINAESESWVDPADRSSGYVARTVGSFTRSGAYSWGKPLTNPEAAMRIAEQDPTLYRQLLAQSASKQEIYAEVLNTAFLNAGQPGVRSTNVRRVRDASGQESYEDRAVDLSAHPELASQIMQVAGFEAKGEPVGYQHLATAIQVVLQGHGVNPTTRFKFTTAEGQELYLSNARSAAYFSGPHWQKDMVSLLDGEIDPKGQARMQAIVSRYGRTQVAVLETLAARLQVNAGLADRLFASETELIAGREFHRNMTGLSARHSWAGPVVGDSKMPRNTVAAPDAVLAEMFPELASHPERIDSLKAFIDGHQVATTGNREPSPARLQQFYALRLVTLDSVRDRITIQDTSRLVIHPSVIGQASGDFDGDGFKALMRSLIAWNDKVGGWEMSNRATPLSVRQVKDQAELLESLTVGSGGAPGLVGLRLDSLKSDQEQMAAHGNSLSEYNRSQILKMGNLGSFSMETLQGGLGWLRKSKEEVGTNYNLGRDLRALSGDDERFADLAATFNQLYVDAGRASPGLARFMENMTGYQPATRYVKRSDASGKLSFQRFSSNASAAFDTLAALMQAKELGNSQFVAELLWPDDDDPQAAGKRKLLVEIRESGDYSRLAEVFGDDPYADAAGLSPIPQLFRAHASQRQARRLERNRERPGTTPLAPMSDEDRAWAEVGQGLAAGVRVASSRFTRVRGQGSAEANLQATTEQIFSAYASQQRDPRLGAYYQRVIDPMLGIVEGGSHSVGELIQAMKDQASLLAKGPGVKLATGGGFVVPPGYDNDDYLIGVKSGERVTVETPAQRARRVMRKFAGGTGGPAHDELEELPSLLTQYLRGVTTELTPQQKKRLQMGRSGTAGMWTEDTRMMYLNPEYGAQKKEAGSRDLAHVVAHEAGHAIHSLVSDATDYMRDEYAGETGYQRAPWMDERPDEPGRIEAAGQLAEADYPLRSVFEKHNRLLEEAAKNVSHNPALRSWRRWLRKKGYHHDQLPEEFYAETFATARTGPRDETQRYAGFAQYAKSANIMWAALRRMGAPEGDQPNRALPGLTDIDFAAGTQGGFVVPPGYNNDDYLIGVQSGEEVQVLTPAQRARRDLARRSHGVAERLFSQGGRGTGRGYDPNDPNDPNYPRGFSGADDPRAHAAGADLTGSEMDSNKDMFLLNWLQHQKFKIRGQAVLPTSTAGDQGTKIHEEIQRQERAARGSAELGGHIRFSEVGINGVVPGAGLGPLDAQGQPTDIANIKVAGRLDLIDLWKEGSQWYAKTPDYKTGGETADHSGQLGLYPWILSHGGEIQQRGEGTELLAFLAHLQQAEGITGFGSGPNQIKVVGSQVITPSSPAAGRPIAEVAAEMRANSLAAGPAAPSMDPDRVPALAARQLRLKQDVAGHAADWQAALRRLGASGRPEDQALREQLHSRIFSEQVNAVGSFMNYANRASAGRSSPASRGTPRPAGGLGGAGSYWSPATDVDLHVAAPQAARAGIALQNFLEGGELDMHAILGYGADILSRPELLKQFSTLEQARAGEAGRQGMPGIVHAGGLTQDFIQQNLPQMAHDQQAFFRPPQAQRGTAPVPPVGTPAQAEQLDYWGNLVSPARAASADYVPGRAASADYKPGLPAGPGFGAVQELVRAAGTLGGRGRFALARDDQGNYSTDVEALTRHASPEIKALVPVFKDLAEAGDKLHKSFVALSEATADTGMTPRQAQWADTAQKTLKQIDAALIPIRETIDFNSMPPAGTELGAELSGAVNAAGGLAGRATRMGASGPPPGGIKGWLQGLFGGGDYGDGGGGGGGGAGALGRLERGQQLLTGVQMIYMARLDRMLVEPALQGVTNMANMQRGGAQLMAAAGLGYQPTNMMQTAGGWQAMQNNAASNGGLTWAAMLQGGTKLGNPTAGLTSILGPAAGIGAMGAYIAAQALPATIGGTLVGGELVGALPIAGPAAIGAGVALAASVTGLGLLSRQQGMVANPAQAGVVAYNAQPTSSPSAPGLIEGVTRGWGTLLQDVENNPAGLIDARGGGPVGMLTRAALENRAAWDASRSQGAATAQLLQGGLSLGKLSHLNGDQRQAALGAWLNGIGGQPGALQTYGLDQATTLSAGQVAWTYNLPEPLAMQAAAAGMNIPQMAAQFQSAYGGTLEGNAARAATYTNAPLAGQQAVAGTATPLFSALSAAGQPPTPGQAEIIPTLSGAVSSRAGGLAQQAYSAQQYNLLTGRSQSQVNGALWAAQQAILGKAQGMPDAQIQGALTAGLQSMATESQQAGAHGQLAALYQARGMDVNVANALATADETRFGGDLTTGSGFDYLQNKTQQAGGLSQLSSLYQARGMSAASALARAKTEEAHFGGDLTTGAGFAHVQTQTQALRSFQGLQSVLETRGGMTAGAAYGAAQSAEHLFGGNLGAGQGAQFTQAFAGYLSGNANIVSQVSAIQGAAPSFTTAGGYNVSGAQMVTMGQGGASGFAGMGIGQASVLLRNQTAAGGGTELRGPGGAGAGLFAAPALASVAQAAYASGGYTTRGNAMLGGYVPLGVGMGTMPASYQIGGQTYTWGQNIGGLVALQQQASDISYSGQMASAGLSLANLAREQAYTTGAGVERQTNIYAGKPLPWSTTGAVGAPFQAGQGLWYVADQGVQLQRQQAASSYGFTMAGIGLQGAQFAQNQALASSQFTAGQALNLSQFTENQAFNQRASALTFARTQQDLSLSRTQQLYGRQYATQDIAFDTANTQRQYGWQMQDINLDLRYATGRDRITLEREKSRATVTENVAMTREDTLTGRNKQMWALEDSRYAVEVQRAAQDFKIRSEQWDLENKHFGESAALTKKNFDDSQALAKRQSAEQLALQSQVATTNYDFTLKQQQLDDQGQQLQRSYWTDNLAAQKAAVGIQAGVATALKENADKQAALNLAMQANTSQVATWYDTEYGMMQTWIGHMQTIEAMILAGKIADITIGNNNPNHDGHSTVGNGPRAAGLSQMLFTTPAALSVAEMGPEVVTVTPFGRPGFGYAATPAAPAAGAAGAAGDVYVFIGNEQVVARVERGITNHLTGARRR